MAATQSNSKRPTCSVCSKPTRICLCSRIQNPGLDNKIHITILQHSLEKKHPLNSVRIAQLGLKNLTIATVSDINTTAKFFIRRLEPGSDKEIQKRKFDDIDTIQESRGKISFSISKNGAITQEIQESLNLDEILTSKEILECLTKGFMIKKQNSEGLTEFEIEIPEGSVLLFPSENAVSINEIQEMGNEVKNLIVLDGTWAKAKRIYKENPWLIFLPHLKLELDKLSLYSEVRHQPKVGCLSTIESIVYAMKEIGNFPHGIDDLLDVFESMICDQRKCKNERLNKV